MELRSPAFHEGTTIPVRHTCDGDGRSPPLDWSGVPAGSRSLVLIVDDPDAPDPAAPKRTWVHWIRYNLPAGSTGLPEAAGNHPPDPPALDAVTDNRRRGYHGPCPPVGRHRYFFRLLALDTVLPALGPDAHRSDVERAAQGHVLGQAELMGTYGPREGN